MPNVYETTDAPGNSSTTYWLSMGDIVQGNLTTNDHDYYRVSLIAGHSYTFSLTGTGVNSVNDTYLRLYGPDGVTQVAANDDGLPNLNSQLTYAATTSGVYFIDAAAFAGIGTGQYEMNVAEGPRPVWDAQMGAGVLNTHSSWSATPGTGVTVTWAARRTGTGVDGQGAAAPFSQFSNAEIAAVTQMLQSISDVSGIRFQRLDDGDGFSDNATMLFGNYYSTTDNAGAHAYFPGSTAASSNNGDVWANTNSVSTISSGLGMGSYSYLTLMHEIGHAVGLSHPGVYNAGPGSNPTYASNAEFQQDTQEFTMMSYFDESNTGAQYNGYANTPMMFDVAALQNIYGQNLTTRTSDTVYGFNATAGAPFSFTAGAHAFTIWDAGGNDTLDGSGYAGAQTINLNWGGFSSMDGMTNNVCVAVGATIENAVGGAGNDLLIGNSTGNWLMGGAGNDILAGGDGSDVLLGGAGADVMVGGAGSDFYEVDNVGDTVYETPSSDYDTVYAYVNYALPDNVENLVMLYGNQTYGFGNSGNNYIVGNAQSNVIQGGGGYDILTGGGGSDYFFVSAGWGVNVITDFTAGLGTDDAVIFSSSVFQNFAQVYAASAQVGSDTWIGDGAGDTLILMNVNRTSLATSDFGFV